MGSFVLLLDNIVPLWIHIVPCCPFRFVFDFWVLSAFWPCTVAFGYDINLEIWAYMS